MTQSRIIEQGGEGAELVKAAQDFEPPRAGRERLLTALSAGGLTAVAGLSASTTAAAATGVSSVGQAAAGTSASGASAAAVATGTTGAATTGISILAKVSAVKPLLVVVGLTAAATTTVVVTRQVHDETRVEQGAPAREQDSKPAVPSQSLRTDSAPQDDHAKPELEPDQEDGIDEPRDEPPRTSAGSPIRRTPAEAGPAEAGPAEAGLEMPTAPPFSEIDGLKQGRALLRQGRAAAALTVLGQHSKYYPGSSLSLEREVLTIEALAAAGEKAVAQARAQRFVATHPHSLLSERLRSIAGTAGVPTERREEK